METITQRQGEIVGRQNPRPNSSISARRDGYICSCDNGAYCDGVCYFRSAPTTSIENNNNAISHAAAGRSSADPFSETEIYAELRRLTEELKTQKDRIRIFENTLKRKDLELSDQLGSIDRLMAENAMLKAQLGESDRNLALVLANEGTITTPGSNALSTAPRSVEVIQTPAKSRAQTATPIQNVINNYGTIHLHISAEAFPQPTRSGSYAPQESVQQSKHQPEPALKYIVCPGSAMGRRRALLDIGYGENEVTALAESMSRFEKALRAKGYTCEK